MDIVQIIIPLIIFVIIVIPLGRYIYNVLSEEKSFVDPVLDRVDNFIYKLTGIKKEEMTVPEFDTEIKKLAVLNLTIKTPWKNGDK